jgi:hypothetical protein
MADGGRGGHWNRAGRRSGGAQRFVMPAGSLPGVLGETELRGPLSLPCFGGRHSDCFGTCKPLAPEDCGCACHDEKQSA